jgi:RNA polymerase-binding transcription factor DksA
LEKNMQDRKEALQREIDKLRAQIAAMEAALEDKPEYGIGGGASAATRWELDRAILQQLRERATGLDRALSQAGEAADGICVRCGKPIHPDRLAVLPDTQVCVECARMGERAAVPQPAG